MFSNRNNVRGWLMGVLVAGVALVPSIARAQAAASAQNSYDELYQKYLQQARTPPAAPSSWMTNLLGDPRARHLNDIVTIRVVENLSATGAADANVSKAGKADVSVPSPVSKVFSKAVPTSTETKFQGAGGTTRAGTMTAVVTGRVIEVLPNGDMVVEGVREIQVNNDRQVVVLTGIIRAVDVQPGNVVSSASVAQLRIQCLGKGLIKDSLSPGWLIRVLNKIF